MRYSYGPVYYDQPASARLTGANADDADWYDPAEIDANGNPIDPYGAALPVNDYPQPAAPGDFHATQSPTARVRQFGEISDSQTSGHPDEAFLARYYDEELRRAQERRFLPDFSSNIGSYAGSRHLQDSYMHQLAMRSMMLAQEREKTMREKLLEDYFSRLLRGGGAPI